MCNETNRYTSLDNARNNEYISKFHVHVDSKNINPLKVMTLWTTHSMNRGI